MKIIVDMNLSPEWVDVLTSAGWQAAHWSALGAGNAADRTIMDYARASGSVVLTHDLDFGMILAVTHGQKPSVVQIRSDDVSPEVIGQRVTSALTQLTLELANGALISIDTKQTRVRILPLRQPG